MADSQKLVLMVQMSKLQGLIWQAVLKSQQISVIWEAPDIDLIDSIEQLKQAGLALPDLLLIDVRLPGFNAYEFCRWCREYHPIVKVVLTNDSQKVISHSERQWAIYQGAADLLPGFQRENLVSSVAVAVKRLLEILDSPLNNGALISVLLTMKRQLEARQTGWERAPLNGQSATNQNGHSSPEKPRSPSAQPSVAQNGQPPSLDPNGKTSSTSTSKGSSSEPPDDDPPPIRRYRGLTY